MTLNKAAQELGRLSKGVPKTLTLKERKRRRDHMIRVNEQRRKK